MLRHIRKKQYFCKPDIKKTLGVGLGFIRKLNATNLGFLKIPNMRILKITRKNSFSNKPDFKQIVGVGLGFIRKACAS